MFGRRDTREAELARHPERHCPACATQIERRAVRRANDRLSGNHGGIS